MKKFDIVKEAKIINIIIYSFMAAVGLFLLLFTGLTSVQEAIIISVLCILAGGAKILGYFSNDLYRLACQFDLAVGILSSILGLLLILRPDAVLSFLPTVVGVFILVDSILRFQTSIDAKHFGMDKWWGILLISCAGAVLGVLLLFRPFESAMAMIRLIGLTLMIDGVENLVTCAYTVKVPRRSAADPTVIDADFTEADDD